MKTLLLRLRFIAVVILINLLTTGWGGGTAHAAKILPELEGKAVSLALPWVNEVETGRWYVMYNVGRKGFLYDDETKLYISTAPPAPDAMQYLVRLVDKNGYKVVQTGRGRYFTTLSTSNNSGTTTSASTTNAYTIGTIGEGHFWLKDSKGMVLDANALGSAIDAKSTVAGWGTTTPTATNGNNSWRFFPVEMTNVEDEFADVPRSFGNFSFQSVENGKYLYLDSHNLGLLDMEAAEEGREVPMGSALLGGDGQWTLGMPEGTDGKGFFHIGTDGKFSAGPATPLRLYRATALDDGAKYVFTEAASVWDGASYLIVGTYEGNDYALVDVIGSAGSSSQRMLSDKVKFTPRLTENTEDGETASSDGTLVATFTGTNASNITGHLWQLHFGETITQDPFVYTTGETGGASGEGKPLLTIACVSDIHTQEGWLSEGSWADKDNAYYNAKDIKDVKVRESLLETVEALKGENVDVLIVGGDCQSDATVDEEHWRQVRRLMADALRSANASKTAGTADDPDVPVLYVNGNHEYEVASTWGGNGRGYYNWRYTRPFNAGEYYEFPMMSDIGVLAADYDCFYEDAPNDGLVAARKTMPVLAAYHYSLKGFDFVVLNCGKHLFGNANNYSYSDESVEWVGRKLEQLYVDDPTHTKTVFFALHIPFGDSNSINTSEDKGMSYYASTRRLKAILAQYPGLVMLYGHDHGQDLAYIRSKTSQRVTRYDSNGNVMATADGTDTFDKELKAGAVSKASAYEGQSVIFHPYSGKTEACLGLKGGFNVGSAGATRTMALLDYTSYCTIYPETEGTVSLRLGDGSEHLRYNSGFGITTAEHSPLVLYHVTIDGSSFTYEPVQKVEDGEIYLIGSESYIYKVGGSRPLSKTGAFSVTTYSSYFFRAELPQAAQPSFVSSFMGSMRYYNNSNGEPANSSHSERKLVQGLLVYVYPDRIVFNMKNFRNNAQSRVRNELAPYVVKRTTPAVAEEAIVRHNPSGAYYRRVDDLAQLKPGSVCVLVDESRGRSIGLMSNSTGKLQAVVVDVDAEAGRMEVSRNSSECEFTFEKKATGALTLDVADNTWYLRTHDGYLKMADSKVFYRQQSQNYYTTNPLANEALNATVIPWTISLDEAGIATIENAEVGLLRKQTSGMTTANFCLYQKVVPATVDAAMGLATLYAEHALWMPEDVEAYTITGLTDDGSFRFERQTTKVPAKTGLVLRRSAKSTEETIEIPVIDDRYAAPLTNCLAGTLSTIMTSATTDDARFYRLDPTEKTAVPTFTLAEGTGSAFVNPCGEAYLVLSASDAARHELAPMRSIVELLDAAEVNGNKDVVLPGQAAGSAVYTIAGQRVGTDTTTLPSRPGLYIVGGKKMVVK